MTTFDEAAIARAAGALPIGFPSVVRIGMPARWNDSEKPPTVTPPPPSPAPATGHVLRAGTHQWPGGTTSTIATKRPPQPLPPTGGAENAAREPSQRPVPNPPNVTMPGRPPTRTDPTTRPLPLAGRIRRDLPAQPPSGGEPGGDQHRHCIQAITMCGSRECRGPRSGSPSPPTEPSDTPLTEVLEYLPFTAGS
jgi:hypothetical protein